MTVKVGVVGLGFMGKTHLGIHLKNQRAKVTAYCDIDPQKAAGDFGAAGGSLALLPVAAIALAAGLRLPYGARTKASRPGKRSKWTPSICRARPG